MSTTTTFEKSRVTNKLISARNFFKKSKNSFTKGQLDSQYKDTGETQHCILGALKLTDDAQYAARPYSARDFVIKAIIKLFPGRIYGHCHGRDQTNMPAAFNDHASTTRDDIIKVLDMAIDMSVRRDCKVFKENGRV